MKHLGFGISAVCLIVGCTKPAPPSEERPITVSAELATADVVGALVSRPSPMPILEWSPSVFSFVVEEGGQHYLILQEEGLENVTPTSLTSLRREHSVEATLAPQDILAYENELVGKPFVVYGRDGEVCRATLGPVVAIARADGVDYLAVDFFNDTAPTEKFASVIWEHGQRMRVARLNATTECLGAIWARAEGERPANVLARFEPTEDTKSQILKRFKALPGYARVQDEYVNYINEMSAIEAQAGNVPNWGETEDIDQSISGFRDLISGREFLQVTMQGDVGCGAANSEFWAIFVKREGSWDVVTDPNQPGRLFGAALAVDANLDGQPEFVGAGFSYTSYGEDQDRQLIELKGATYSQTRSTSFPFFGCRC